MGKGLVGLRHLMSIFPFFMSAPRLLAASANSAASLASMDFSLRALAKLMSQRMASDTRRSARTSTGTW